MNYYRNIKRFQWLTYKEIMMNAFFINRSLKNTKMHDWLRMAIGPIGRLVLNVGLRAIKYLLIIYIN